jgi:hypothetical protein
MRYLNAKPIDLIYVYVEKLLETLNRTGNKFPESDLMIIFEILDMTNCEEQRFQNLIFQTW